MHDRLERHPRLAVLMTEALTRDTYAALLVRLHAFYAPLEAALHRHDDVFGFGDRRKAGLLAGDLRALGRAVAETPCAALPDVTDPARALGCHYVLEGATLGGAIIRRHVERSIGVTRGEGGAFYAGYGRATAARWRAFCACVDAYDAGRWRPGGAEPARDDVVAGARATFEAMYAWLSAPAPRPRTPVPSHRAAL